MALDVINNRGSVESLVKALSKDIEESALQAGSKIPSLRNLATHYGMSYATVSKAVNKLTSEGLLTARRGAGVFVAQDDAEVAKKQAYNISMIQSDAPEHVLEASIYTKLLHSVELSLRTNGHNFSLSNLTSNDSQMYFSSESFAKADGFIINGKADAELESRLAGRPHVWVMGSADRNTGDIVSYNDRFSGIEAAKYFVQKDHSKVACILTDNKRDYALFDRFNSLENHLQKNNVDMVTIDCDGAHVVTDTEQHFEHAVIRKKLTEAFEANPDITAIFTGMDMLTVVVSNILSQMGKIPGEDVELVGCNCEKRFLSSIEYKVSSIDLHTEKIGNKAVEQLIWRLENPKEPQIDIRIRPTLKHFNVG